MIARCRRRHRSARIGSSRRCGPLGGGLVVPVALTVAVLVSSCGDAAADRSSETGAGDVAAAATVPVSDEAEGVLEVEGEATPVRPVVEIPDRWDSAVEELYGRYWLYWEAFAAAHGPPNADPAYEPLRELSTPENWDSLQAQLRSFADDGLILQLPERSITEHMIRVPNAAVISRDEGAEVIMQDCWIDDFVQRTVDGSVLLETREAKLMNVVMTVVDGQWRVDGVTRATTESDGFEACQELVS